MSICSKCVSCFVIFCCSIVVVMFACILVISCFLFSCLLCVSHFICVVVVLFFFFFFKQKTAYEMRISDWSSDVCSSDLLFIWFFGLPRFGILLPAFVCGVLGMGMYSASYVSEVVRGAIQSVDRGQREAARSLGMSSTQAMIKIILPQAFVRMIPPLGNEFIALIKNSALVSLVTIHDLMHEGQKIISVSYRSLETYLVIAVVYWILTSATTMALRRIELRLQAGGMVQ